MRLNLDVQQHVLTFLADQASNNALLLDDLPRKNFSLGQLSHAVEMLLEQRLIRAKKGLQADTDEHIPYIIFGLTLAGHQYRASLPAKASVLSKLQILAKRIWQGLLCESEKQIYQWIVRGIGALFFAYIAKFSLAYFSG